MRHRRRRTILLIALGVLLFLVISALLTRALSVGGAEDTAITDLVRAEATRQRGPGGVRRSMGCASSPACRARATANAAALKRPGKVSVIQIQQSAGFSLGSTQGTARVAWLVGDSLPIVQCVRVRHAGNVLQGFTIELLVVSRRIKSDAACPSRF